MIKDIIESNKIVDVNEIKLKQLREVFPGAFIGETVDLEYIKNQLKETKVIKEGFELNFLGKSYAKLLAALDTETVIVPNNEHNKRDENKNSENLYITADNLEALKHLLKSYWHKIKMIYIDPPYNTGSDGFVYNDSFKFTKENLNEKLGLSDEEAERVIEMTNSGSSSHSAWLTFIYPRLLLSKYLLSEDGVIFISIDYHEHHNLKSICNEIYGENNLVGEFTWEKHKAPKNDNKFITMNHEFVLVYANNIDVFSLKKRPRSEENIKSFSNPDNDPRGPWSSGPLLAPTFTRSTVFPIVTPNGREVLPPQGKCWSFNKEGIDRLMNEDRIWFGADGNNVPRIKRFLSELSDGIGVVSVLDHDTYGGNQKAANQLSKLFDGRKIFDYSKPVSLIKYFIERIEGSDFYILDFFAGSSTTAHATIEANDQDNGKRKFIMIQLNEETKEDSEARKNGYKTISEIGIDRILRVYKQYGANASLLSTIDRGFKHFNVESIKENQLIKLDKFNPNILFTDRGILDEFGIDTVLTTWKNFDGYGLSREWKELEFSDYTAYQIDRTIYLLNPNISNNAVKAFLEKYEEDNFLCNKIVIFGYSFTMSEIQSIKDNLKQVESIRHITLDIIVRY